MPLMVSQKITYICDTIGDNKKKFNTSYPVESTFEVGENVSMVAQNVFLNLTNTSTLQVISSYW